MHFKCLACGKQIYDYPNPVEHITQELKLTKTINTLVITWEHPEICDLCKAIILRLAADSIEYGEYAYGDHPEEVYLQ